MSAKLRHERFEWSSLQIFTLDQLYIIERLHFGEQKMETVIARANTWPDAHEIPIITMRAISDHFLAQNQVSGFAA